MGVAKFKISTEPPSVVINDQDVTNILSRITVDMRPQRPAEIFVEMKQGEGTIEGDGVVNIVRAGTDLVEWIRKLNPLQIERLLLEEQSGFGGSTMGEAVVAVLMGLASSGD